MPPKNEAKLHDFPDRLIGRLQAIPAHLRELVQQVAPPLAARLEFEKAQPLQKKMQLPDWRRLESDLLFEVPLRDRGEADAALICLLIECQMKADPAMPLRTLLYAVFYWEQLWRSWESRHARHEPLRLNPVLPIVLHTGARPWKTNRTLADLFAGPEALRPFQPVWAPLLWDLPTHDADELLKLPGHWLPMLATIRVERGSRKEYEKVLEKLLHRLEPLSKKEHALWRQLMEFVLSWSLRRRPRQEYPRIYKKGIEVYNDVQLQEEVEEMAKTLGKSWIDEAYEKGEKRGRKEGRTEGRQEGRGEGELIASRKYLRKLLEDRFGTLPQAVARRIESATNVSRLEAALLKVWHVKSLDELDI